MKNDNLKVDEVYYFGKKVNDEHVDQIEDF